MSRRAHPAWAMALVMLALGGCGDRAAIGPAAAPPSAAPASPAAAELGTPAAPLPCTLDPAAPAQPGCSACKPEYLREPGEKERR
jgi:hypothetical protein